MKLRQKLKKVLLIGLFALFTLASAQAYVEAPCPRLLVLSEVEGETVVCGFLSVPESRTREAGRELELAVMTLKSRSDTPLADPILFLQGGPGGAALSTIEMWQDLPWRDSRDIILLDQRGTGYSVPNLKCPEIYVELDIALGVKSCRNRLLREGHDLRAFNSAEDAADVADLRAALEVEGFNLYGVSYGTRLALTVMRDYPEVIRSVVLDSTYPPQVNRLVEFGPNFDRALTRVFDACLESERCNKAFPDLEESFLTTIEDFNDLALELDDLEGLEDFTLTGSDLLGLYFQSMYSEVIIPNIPYSMTKLAQDDFWSAILLLSGVVSGEEVDSGNANVLAVFRVLRELFKWFWREVQAEGVYFSTECQEDVPFQTLQEVLGQAEMLQPVIGQFVEDTGRDQFSMCRAWRVPAAGDVESQAVESDIPTLVLAGSFDPITPPSWGRRAAQTLSNSYFFEFPNAAHGVFLSGDCPVGMVEAFLKSPEAEPNGECIESLEVEFYVPESE